MNYGTWGLKSDKDSLLRLQDCSAFRQILLLMALIRRLFVVTSPILFLSCSEAYILRLLSNSLQDASSPVPGADSSSDVIRCSI